MLSLFNDPGASAAHPPAVIPPPLPPTNPSSSIMSSFEAAFASGASGANNKQTSHRNSASAQPLVDLNKFSGKRLKYMKAKIEAEEKEMKVFKSKGERLAAPLRWTKHCVPKYNLLNSSLRDSLCPPSPSFCLCKLRR